MQFCDLGDKHFWNDKGETCENGGTKKNQEGMDHGMFIIVEKKSNIIFHI